MSDCVPTTVHVLYYELSRESEFVRVREEGSKQRTITILLFPPIPNSPYPSRHYPINVTFGNHQHQDRVYKYRNGQPVSMFKKFSRVYKLIIVT